MANATRQRRKQAYRWSDASRTVGLDTTVVVTTVALIAIGIVMVSSTSMAVAESFAVSGWHYISRHLIYLIIGVAAACSLRLIAIRHLQAAAMLCLPLSVIMLLLPFVPGLGHEVNGSTRWIDLGIVRFQVVEAVKLLMVIFVAGYLSRHPELFRARFGVTLKPLIAVGLLAGLLLLQPDMGSAVILVAIVAGMIWLAGAALKHLFVLGASGLPLIGFAALEPYRLQRVMTFVDPWADPFNAGFQLTQALIAVGRGQISGVGLGASVQKLYYLPEAHTDFIFAVLAEEFGLLGIVLVIALFALLVGRILGIGLRALNQDKPFPAYLAWGIGLWIGIQALVSIAVNLGMLPTKGLTLPLISSGGSSLIMTIIAIGVVLRIDWELKREQLERPRRRRDWSV